MENYFLAMEKIFFHKVIFYPIPKPGTKIFVRDKKYFVPEYFDFAKDNFDFVPDKNNFDGAKRRGKCLLYL